MPHSHQNHHQPRSHRPAGFTLLEILIALAIAAIVLGAGVSFFMSMSYHRREAATRARFYQEAGALQAMIQEDITGAGAGTGDTTGGMKTVGRYEGREIPAVAVGGDPMNIGLRKDPPSLVVLRTGGAGGTVVAVNGDTVVLATQTPEAWTALPAGAVLMFAGNAPTTSMTRLAATPRLATSADVPGIDVSGCVTLQLNRGACACGPIESLDDRAVAVGATVTTVTGAIKYFTSALGVSGTRSGVYSQGNGLWRFLYQDCAVDPSPDNKTLVSFNGNATFAMTESGGATPPGVRVTLDRSDWRGNPLGYTFDVGVDEWTTP